MIMKPYSPELGFGTNLVGGPELHSVNLGMLILFCGQSSSHNLVLVKLQPRTETQINTSSFSTIYFSKRREKELNQTLTLKVTIFPPRRAGSLQVKEGNRGLYAALCIEGLVPKPQDQFVSFFFFFQKDPFGYKVIIKQYSII